MEAKQLMDQGLLVPDSVVIGMIRNKLEQNTQAKGFIFDGFPRTAEQAEALDRFLGSKGMPVTAMVALEVPDAELRERLLKRGETSGRADDATAEVVERRIAVYKAETAPVAGHYAAQTKYTAVDGVGSLEVVTERLRQAIDIARGA